MNVMNSLFKYATPLIYWLLVIVWTYIFFFYIKKITKKNENYKLLNLLLIILAIDAFRTLIESIYFGSWYTSLSGLLPVEVFNFLAKPEIVFYPKIINLIVAILILMLIIRKWLPAELKEKEKIQIQIEEQVKELVHLNNDLAVAKEKAEQSDLLKSAFLANMSHEIRTPMNGILGFSELLKNPELTGEKQQQYIQVIEKSGERMLSIINDIIDISKIESGLMEIRLVEFDINELTDYLYAFFKLEANAKGLEFVYVKNTDLNKPLVKTDKEKLTSILTNIIKNAIKYTHTGSIEFGWKSNSSFYEFFIKDSGIGINQSQHEIIFKRFSQIDTENKMAIQGSGLGLSISSAFVKMLNGKIWVDSSEGNGATFFVRLPFNAHFLEIKSFQEVSELNIDSTQESCEQTGLKILIAEDDENSGLFLSEIVKEVAKSVLWVKTGIDAVETCKNNNDIDLILMDIQMPGLNGYEATDKIRAFNKNVIIIAQTAYGLSGDREKAIAAGCNSHISKPIVKEKLLQLIKKHCLS